MENFMVLKGCGGYFNDHENPLNIGNVRKTSRMKIDLFNCGGYALNTLNWFLPYAADFVSPCVFHNISEDEYYDNDYDLDDDDVERDIDYSIFQDEVEEIIVDNDLDYDLEEVINEIYYRKNFSHEVSLLLAEKRILKIFSDVRKINSFEELKENEYGIAYAGGPTDFHFARYDNGQISHKPGRSHIRKEKCLEDAFSCRYDSRKILFAKKK